MPATPLPPIAMPPGAVPPPPVPPAPFPVLPLTSEHKTANDACIKRLAQLNVPVGAKIYPELKQPGTHGADILVQTNVFGIEVHKQTNIFQYSVSIKADISPTKEVVFTKKGKEDFVVTDRHEKCTTIFYNALDQYPDFFKTSENCFVYDGQSVLFSTIDIFAASEHMPKTRILVINGAECGLPDLERLGAIMLEVYATKNPRIKFSAEELGRRTSDANIESVNRAYEQILELALNQQCIRDTSRCVVFEHGKMFFFKPLEEGYSRNDCLEVGDGKRMMPGIKKTVNFIEGPYGRGQNNPSVVIDGMKVAFHEEQSILEKLKFIATSDISQGMNVYERERCGPVIKGLDCYSNYLGRKRHLKIEGIHHEGPDTARFVLKDGSISTVFEYFKSHRGISLKYPKANLIICKERGNQNFYPSELMFITPNQRVKISQQTSAQSQRTTKESAVLPDVRQRLIMTGKLAVKISNENPVLHGLGVTVCEEPLVVKGKQFPPVKISMVPTGDSKIVPMRDSKWRFNQYARPATFPDCWAMYSVAHPNTRFSLDLLRGFSDEYMRVFREKGCRVPRPAEMGMVAPGQIEEKLKFASENKCRFVLIITDDCIVDLHQKYKLWETKNLMVIQDMTVSKAISVVTQGKKLTLENVINKSNMKLGGINYFCSDTKKFLDDALVIGIGFSNPPPGTKFVMKGKGLLNPTIIGFAHNATEAQAFTGDFLLSPTGQDTIAPVEDIVRQALLQYKSWRKGATPKRVVVYRTGSSAGTHGSIIGYEVPLACAAIRDSCEASLVYITVSKDHTYRFFRSNLNAITSQAHALASTSGSRQTSGAAKACDMNVGPGLCIDQAVTNPACKQFFLNSHITLQGTAKTPLYSVLFDDTKSSMASLEEMTYNLCHLHQIVGLPTSLPTPLYVANEYAKRGRNLWNEANMADPLLEDIGSESTRLKYITQTINYETAGFLHDRRVNA